MDSSHSKEAGFVTKEQSTQDNNSPVAEAPTVQGSGDVDIRLNGDGVRKDFQHGVQSAQAVTQLWGTTQLVFVYILWVS